MQMIAKEKLITNSNHNEKEDAGDKERQITSCMMLTLTRYKKKQH